MLIVCFYFPAIELNEDCAEEGEVFGYQEEVDQGQATQGKPSILDAYLNPIHLLCRLHKGLLKCMFLYAITLVAIVLMAQAPQAKLLSSFEMTPLNTYSLPLQ
jgi:hypothetical protein